MVTCEVCGAALVDDRGCSYCDGTYCQAHQLPEHHDCPGVGERRDSAGETGTGSGDGDGDGDGDDRRD
ncbi:MAG: AN1-type zinc finger domain-containing protein [Haloferacaceae archaeon]